MFEREVTRAQHSGKSLCLMMIDIDNFKHFNDQYGHIAGDRVLDRRRRGAARVPAAHGPRRPIRRRRVRRVAARPGARAGAADGGAHASSRSRACRRRACRRRSRSRSASRAQRPGDDVAHARAARGRRDVRRQGSGPQPRGGAQLVRPIDCRLAARGRAERRRARSSSLEHPDRSASRDPLRAAPRRSPARSPAASSSARASAFQSRDKSCAPARNRVAHAARAPSAARALARARSASR